MFLCQLRSISFRRCECPLLDRGLFECPVLREGVVLSGPERLLLFNLLLVLRARAVVSVICERRLLCLRPIGFGWSGLRRALASSWVCRGLLLQVSLI